MAIRSVNYEYKKVSSNSRADIKNNNIVTLEQQICNTFKKSYISKADTKKIIESLPKINWNKYEEVNGEDGFELIRWIYELNIEDEEDIINMIKASKSLDAAYSELLAEKLKNMFLQNEIKFVEALSKVPDYTEEIGEELAFACMDKDKFNEDIENLIQSHKLSNVQKKVIKNMKTAFNNFIKRNINS
ncbi:hypothetical protein [Clostridium ganghwense]|uniref:HEAT repeat domain-containing protein n=1 Tax=Clostridium ganghwense TaxID=312089 RepID=A0ABT4CS94_9CLOT|nr:hypothetical protein [Clostridium ganghwense]MCY6371946.1 hypothetical protein [Clostridium ganghwense]